MENLAAATPYSANAMNFKNTWVTGIALYSMYLFTISIIEKHGHLNFALTLLSVAVSLWYHHQWKFSMARTSDNIVQLLSLNDLLSLWLGPVIW
jgi:hypothetical protein